MASVAFSSTNRPIIGILTLPNDHADVYPGRTYFPASYVKFVESGGARVVPIRYTDDEASIRALLPKLNGFLFTGGGADFYQNGELTAFAQTALWILEEVREAHANGESVPLWGTCLGFELINVLAAGPNPNVLTGGWDSENLTIPLTFTDAAPMSKLYGTAPKDAYATFANKASTINNHHSAVAPADFDGNANLTSTFHVLSTNKDRNGKEFVSSIEGIELPIFATQYHPEKAVWEWDTFEDIPHSAEAVWANGWTATFLGRQARLNSRSFNDSTEEAKALIYNYNPVYTGDNAAGFPDFDQCYFFE
jgi:gamma-glutamyl hydrolase